MTTKQINKIRLIAGVIAFVVSASAYALPPNMDVNCLKKEHGQCVSITNTIISNTIGQLLNVPSGVTGVLFGANNRLNWQMEGKSLQECMSGKKVINNAVIRCHNGQ